MTFIERVIAAAGAGSLAFICGSQFVRRLREPKAMYDYPIVQFYGAWGEHKGAGFEASQEEADKLAAVFGVKAPPVEKIFTPKTSSTSYPG